VLKKITTRELVTLPTTKNLQVATGYIELMEPLKDIRKVGDQRINPNLCSGLPGDS